jgi:hypothetical protein
MEMLYSGKQFITTALLEETPRGSTRECPQGCLVPHAVEIDDGLLMG